MATKARSASFIDSFSDSVVRIEGEKETQLLLSLGDATLEALELEASVVSRSLRYPASLTGTCVY
jgi:hypothetical protein